MARAGGLFEIGAHFSFFFSLFCVLSLQLDMYPWRLIYRFRLVSLDVPRNLLLLFIPLYSLYNIFISREKRRWQKSSSFLFRGFPFWYTLVISDSLTTRPVELELSTVTTFFPAEERNRRGVKREKENKKQKTKKSLGGKTCSSRGPAAAAAAGCSGVCASVNIKWLRVTRKNVTRLSAGCAT